MSRPARDQARAGKVSIVVSFVSYVPPSRVGAKCAGKTKLSQGFRLKEGRDNMPQPTWPVANEANEIIHLGDGEKQEVFANFLKAAVGLMFSVGPIAGYLSFGLLADILGRKPTTRLFYLGPLLVSLRLFLLVRDGDTLLVISAANGFFSTGQFAWMTIYLPELFPTRVRGTAMSLVFDSSRSVAALGPLLAGRLVSSLGIGTAAAVMSLMYVVGLTVTPFAGPETNGKSLPA